MIAARVVTLTLSEWATATPETHPALKGTFLEETPRHPRATAKRAPPDRLELLNGRAGLQIRTSSWVGSVQLGGLQIEIRPKLGRAQLPRLLQYTYGLRNLDLFPEAAAPANELGFRDLLAAQLLAEVEAVDRRGFVAHYVRRDASLASPRGQIALTQVATSGGIRTASLPCRHYPRLADWNLNRVVLSGLSMAASLSRDHDLALALHRLTGRLAEHIAPLGLNAAVLSEARRSLTRLTWAYRPALDLIDLLYSMSGTADDGRRVSAPGYLFDMNVFWQAVLSRLFADHLPPALGEIQDERRLYEVMRYVPDANPRRRRPPEPRPDFALIRNGRPWLFLDAKYRDVWTQGYPLDWIYQLGMYAFAASSRVAIMLYPAEDPAARTEKIEIMDPARRQRAAVVVLKPVLVSQLARLVSVVGTSRQARTAAADLAAGLTAP